MELFSTKIKKFQERTFRGQKIQKKPALKKLLIFREMKLSCSKLKKFLFFSIFFAIFKEGTCRAL